MSILIHFFVDFNTCSSIACTHRMCRNKWSEMARRRKSEREVLLWETLFIFKTANHRNGKTDEPSREDIKLSYLAEPSAV